jgi:tetratricopeptide (TPR) repeat protein
MSAALPAGIICFIVYLNSVTCGFVLWDDTDFVLNNPVIRRFDCDLFIWAFTTVPSFSGIWIPLTWISFALDYQIWGLDPFGYHLTNILLHSANVMLLVLIADCLCKIIFIEINASKYFINLTLILVGLFFGIHPLRVESVAWVTERKDVLNGIFTFGSIYLYLRYILNKDGAFRDKINICYLLSLVFFLLSLMAKPVSVVLPFLLIVADWHFGRINIKNYITIFWEKIPFLLISVIVTLTTLYIGSGKGGLLVSMTNFPLMERLATSGNAIFQYLRLVLIPVGIVQYAPLPTPLPYTYMFNGSIILALAVFVIISKNRIIISSALCFLLPLIPTLALFQNNDHAYAARYTYLPAAIPSIAIVVASTLSYRNLSGKRRQIYKQFLVASAVFILLAYVMITEKLINTWRDTGTFWSRIIEVTPIGRAYQERGLYYFSKGEYTLAIDDLTKAIEIAFSLEMYDRYNLNVFRGEACRRVQRYEEAVKEFTFVISKAPRPVYFYHRGLAFKALGRIKEANEDFIQSGTETGPLDWY